MNNEARTTPPSLFLLYGAILCALTPWLITQLNQSINVDLAFLTQSALYMLDGLKMSQAYYDTNPPLSIIIYLPAALMTKAASMPVYDAVFLYSILWIALSTYLTFKCLKAIPEITQPQRHLIIALYIITNTLAAQLYLGEKDQLIALALVPFILAQYCLSRNKALPRFMQNIVLGLGALMIMVKPHFYVLPAAMILHRALTQKRISAFWDKDALFLIGGAILYAVVLFVFFQDFLTIILPDIITFYASIKSPWVSYLCLIGLIIGSVLATCSWLLPKQPQKAATIFFLMFILCLLPVYIQGKGFFYQIFPALVFLTLGLGLSMQTLLDGTIFKKTSPPIKGLLSIVLVCALFITTFYTFLARGKLALTHEEYKNSSLARLITDTPDNHSFFMLNDSTEITQQLAVYTGKPLASRFSSLWFLPMLVNAKKSGAAVGEQEHYAQKYGDMMAQDFKKFSPEILIIGRFNIGQKNDRYFHFIDFFSHYSPQFKNQLTHYNYDQTLSINQRDYFPGTLYPDTIVQYDIYRRKK